MLERWLENFKGDWFHDFADITEDIEGSWSDRAAPSKVKSEISEGDIVRAKGDTELLDFSTGNEFMDGFFNSIDDLRAFEEEMNDATKEQKRVTELSSEDIEELLKTKEEMESIELLKPIFDMFSSFMPEAYNEMVAAQIYPFEESKEYKLWALLQEENLETNPVELLSKYQRNSIPNCTIVARVETITEDKNQEEESDEGELDLGSLLHITDDMAAEFGFKVDHPSIAVSPIAIYR